MDFKVMNKLFVYGTLKKQHSRNHVLGAAEFLGEIKTLPKYTMVNLGSFPGVLDCGSNVISGELYIVEEKLLELCDLIEGHPNFYTRKPIFLDKNTSAWAYFLEIEKYKDFPKVIDGSWKII